MIGRQWKARATSEAAPRYAAHLVHSVLPKLKALEGFRKLQLLERPVDDEVEIVVLTFWESMDAIRAFAGADAGVANVEPAARAVLSSFDHHVDHYEVIADV